jgi:hypothetical protein
LSYTSIHFWAFVACCTLTFTFTFLRLHRHIATADVQATGLLVQCGDDGVRCPKTFLP